jgi:hypothetical protein
MLEQPDRRALHLARAARDDERPSWRQPLYSWIFVIGGLAFAAWDLVDGIRPGMSSGFMIGIGIGFLVMAVPLSRHLWHCYRLIRMADEAGAYGERDPS